MLNTPWILWSMLAGILVAAEMLTGSLYLLALAAGALFGAGFAFYGADASAQLSAAAAVATISVLIVRRWHEAHPKSVSAHDDLDLGASVEVVAWGDNGMSRIYHRGSQWDERIAGGAALLPGKHTIVARDGNVLILEPASSGL